MIFFIPACPHQNEMVNNHPDNMNEEPKKTGNKLTNILKKGIVISGVVARTLIGVGAAALLFLGLKRKI
jgi:hypothetical protein